MNFLWDEKKASGNLRKHGITFDEAATVFLDPLAITGLDPDHSEDEYRFITFGMTSLGQLLVVCHTSRRGAIRIISARKATSGERKLYEEA